MSAYPSGLYMHVAAQHTVISNSLNLCRNIPKRNFFRSLEHGLRFLHALARLQVQEVQPIQHATCVVSPLNFIPKRETMIWWETTCPYFLFRMRLNFPIQFMQLNPSQIMKCLRQHRHTILSGILYRSLPKRCIT